MKASAVLYKRSSEESRIFQKDMSSSVILDLPGKAPKKIEQESLAKKEMGQPQAENNDFIDQENEVIQWDQVELQDKFAELQSEGEKMLKEILNFNEHFNIKELELFAHRRIFSQLEPSHAFDEDEIEALTEKLEESSIKIVQLEANYESALREKIEIQEELALAQLRIAETQALLQKTEDANNETEQNMESTKSQLSKYEVHMDNTTKQIAKFEAELEEERAKVVKLNKELASTPSHNEVAQRKAHSNERESTLKDDTIYELRTSVDEYETKIELLYSEVNKLKAQMELAEEENKELHQQVLDAENRVFDVAAENGQTKAENQQLSLEIQSFYKRLSELQACYNECQRERSDFQCETMALQQKVVKLQADLVDTNSAFQRMMTTPEERRQYTMIERLTLGIRAKFAGAFLGVFAF